MEDSKTVYERIKEGTYEERIPCKVMEIKKEEIRDILENEKDLLDIERLPRVQNSEIFWEGSKKGAHLISKKVTMNKKGKLWALLSPKSEKGVKCTLILSYPYFTHNELLKKAGIREEEYQSSYNKVGSIIHLNIKDESMKHKEIISKVLLSKIKDCRTVIRKTSNINSTFRNIDIELLQGKPVYKTMHKENKLRFMIDYDKVYWNSKLQKERETLGKIIRKGDTVCDMFCGVGPFSILALRKGADVWANDLNPQSIENFKESIILNRKVLGIESGSKIWNEGMEEKVHLYNLDAREFLSKATEEKKEQRNSPRFTHYILNLPELTLTFIKCFVEIEKTEDPNTEKSTVHAYFFVRSGESPVEKIEEEMKRKVECTKRLVRKVSPSKEMWLVSFNLL